MSDIRTILVVSHNHPGESPGGGEICAYEFYASLRSLGTLRTAFLFPLGESGSMTWRGDLVSEYRPGEYCFPYHADGLTAYSVFSDRRTVRGPLRAALATFLTSLKPDVVHFHHYFRVGDGLFHLVRRVLPGALTCLTLHDVKAICPDNGYMLRRHERRWPGGIRQLCPESGADRCAECCGERSRGELDARLARIRSMLGTVDMFIAPSAFVLDRYADWGIPRGRLVHIGNGIPGPRPATAPARGGHQRHDRFAFFGRNIPPKGLGVMLDAIAILDRTGDYRPTFMINSPGLAADSRAAALIGRLSPQARSRVLDLGGYSRSERSERMARTDWVVVPSVWWENSPLVIQEAFLHGRPVIASDVGGMAENVRHGTDGLLFRVGDARDLAGTIRRAVADGGLWGQLAGNLPGPASPEDNRDAVLALYETLLAGRRHARSRPDQAGRPRSSPNGRPAGRAAW